MTPILNWKEIHRLAELLRSEITGATVDRVVVAERPNFPEGFIKSEWSFRLTGGPQQRGDSVLIVSVRAQRPYVYWMPGKGPKASEQGTRSGFDLLLGKTLRGLRITSIETYPQERILTFWFEGPSHARYGLVLFLIAATPEAFLIQRGTLSQNAFSILARSRKKFEEGSLFEIPTGRRAPKVPEIRETLFINGLKGLSRLIERELSFEALELLKTKIAQSLRARLKTLEQSLTSHRTALSRAEAESPWEHWGHCLKSAMHLKPYPQGGAYRILDYSSGEVVSIPADPKRDLSSQVAHLFQLERRKQKRIIEARSRFKTQSEDAARLQALQERLAGLDFDDPEATQQLDDLAREAGFRSKDEDNRSSVRRKSLSWRGREFLSKDGYPILVGRSRDENLELTFRIAKGNDIWMHVRGKPGAHVAVLLPSGKSAPLETLLDAATLTLYFSDGEHWGKTEVAYTQRKYVKRVKNSTEVSYSQSKTLIVTVDRERLERLLSKSIEEHSKPFGQRR